jgi:serine/threonine-protein kinase
MSAARRPDSGRGAADERGGALPSRDEWHRLEPLLDAVLDAPPGRRDALLAELSGGEATKRAELERMVAECEQPDRLLDRTDVDRFAAVLRAESDPIGHSLAGRYRVLREVGRGGMAVVYLARDLKHGRDVAVKVVRPELAAAMGRARFLREIEIAARLRHPHIVPLYDSGEVAGDAQPTTEEPLLYYVMPYETGHSLRHRLTERGPMSVDDAVLIVRDVCEALSHAHQHGIVHRDIKPDNVLLSGRHALVTDFGVARAVTAAVTNAAAGGSTALGTPAYMAPEQAANAGPIDHRADLYAVGVLAYELLAGLPPFDTGDSRDLRTSDVTHAMRELTRLRADVPAILVAIIDRCLQPERDDRWQSADELSAQLAAIAPRANAQARRMTLRIALIGVGAALAAALLSTFALTRARGGRQGPPLVLGRATQLTSERGLEVQPSLSPDGRHVAYAVGSSLRMRIAVRSVDGGRARWLTDDSTANEEMPRWSPDGSRILFLSRGNVASAPAFENAASPAARREIASRTGATISSATWSADGREIAYVRGDSLLAYAVVPRTTRVVTTGRDLHSCTWSPARDAPRIACVSGNSFYVTIGAVSGVGPMFGNLAPSRIVLVPAAGGRAVNVTDSLWLHQSPVWSRDGHTLYYVSNRDGPRDVYALDVRPVGEERRSPRNVPIRVTTGMNAHSIDLSSDGARMAYAVYASSANVWATPIPTGVPAVAGPDSAAPITTGNQTVEGVRVSPDGRWLVYDSDLSGSSDVYRVPLGGGEAERLTRSQAHEFRGTLSPDGRELAYHSFETGSRNIFLLALADRSVRQLTHSADHLAMANWSPDGAALAFFNMTLGEVLVMRRDGGERWGAPRRVASRAWRPEWSPDGRSIAFVSPAEGRIGIVAPASGPQRDIYVPAEGGPRAELAAFAPNGRALYFKSHDAAGRASFWSIPVTGGRPRLLVRFADPAWTSNRFDFATDGRRFYFTVEDRQADVWIASTSAGSADVRR